MRFLVMLMVGACTGGGPMETDDGEDSDVDTDADTDAEGLIAEGTWTTSAEAVVDDGCNLYEGDDDAYGAPSTFTVTRTDGGFETFAQEWDDRSATAEATEADGTLTCAPDGEAYTCTGRVVYWDFRGDGTRAEMWSDVTWSVTLDGAAAMAIAMDEVLDCTGQDCNSIAYWAGVDFPCTTSHTFEASGP